MRVLMLCTLAGAALPLAAQTPLVVRRGVPTTAEVRSDSERAMVRLQLNQELLRSAAENQASAMEVLAQLRRAEMPMVTMNAEPARIAALNSSLQALDLRMHSARRTPRFGVTLDYSPRETDRYGVYVSAVSPGGPADHAGIVAGDIITKIGGRSLARDPKRSGDESMPAIRATEAIATLSVGKSVEVEIRRGTQMKTLKITPVDDTNLALTAPSAGRTIDWSTEMPTMTLRGFPDRTSTNPFAGVMSTGNFALGYSSVFANFELAPMNDKLGAYFGTPAGVLVVNDVPSRMMFTTIIADSMTMLNGRLTSATSSGGRGISVKVDTVNTRRNEIPLQPGDVIVSVDGRKVSSPSQLMRVVGTYDRGDEFKLQIMRQKRAETVTVKMP